MANNKINFEVGFITDSKGLGQLKSELNEIRALANNVNFLEGADPTKIQSMVKAANDLEYAMNSAFDVDLNTVNIQKFNQILEQSGTNLKQVQQGLGQAGALGQSAFLKATAGLMQFNTAAKQTNAFLDSIATSFTNTIKWSIMSGIVNRISSTIQQSYYYVKDLDSALNDIRIVTGKNADEMSRFAESANDAAKALAVTTEDYVQGSLIYYQQGLDDETVKTLTDITAKTSNVTGQSMSAVSEELTAVWNGYKVANEAAKEGMQVYEEYVDKMAAVGASTASDLQELSTAMSKVASAASSMGVDFDDLNAQIATIVSVTRQAPESVGTALKTIYARLGDLKVDGVDEFGVKLGEITSQLQTMGIQILNSNGDMRDMSSVMAEVAEKWVTWTDAQRQAAAVAMAGKRQYNNLVALFDNWDMYGEALKTSMEAAGTLEEQQEIALDSLANKMDQLKATTEDLYDSLYNEEDIKSLVTGLTKIIQLLADFSDATGGLINLIPMLGATALRVFSNQIANGLNTIITNIKNIRTESQMMAENAAQLKMMFADSSLYTNINNSRIDPEIIKQGVQELESYYNKMQQYQNIMDKDQKETYNNILNNIEKVGTLNLKIAENVNELKDVQGTWGLINAEVIKDEQQLSKLTLEINKTNNAANELQTALNSLNGESIDSQTVYNTLKNITGEFKLTDEEVNKLTNEFGRLYDELNGNANQAVKELIKNLKESGQAGTVIAQMTMEAKNLTSGIDGAGKALEENLARKQVISNITNTVGAIGQLATSINTIKNLGSIWSDKDVEIGDKILQTVMNLSFASTGLIGFFTKLNSILPINLNLIKAWSVAIKTQTTAIEANTLAEKFNSVVKQTNRNMTKQGISQIAKEIAVTKGLTNAEIIKIATEKKGQNLSKQQTTYLLAKVKAIWAEKTAEDAATASTEAHNAAILATPIGIAIAGITALIAVLAILAKKREKEHEQILENNKADLENIEAKQEVLKTNSDLIKSYNSLYKKYQNNNEVKNELYEKTLELANAYNIEGAKILALADKYDLLKEKIEAARIAELGINLGEAESGAKKAAENALEEATTGHGYRSNNTYIRKFAVTSQVTGKKSDIDNIERQILEDIGGDQFNGLNYSIKVDFNDPEQVKKYIAETRSIVDRMDAEMTKEQRNRSQVYKEEKEELKELSEYEKKINEQFNQIYTIKTELAIRNSDIFNKDDLIDINKEIDKIKEKLINEELIPPEEVDKNIEKILSGFDGFEDKLNKLDIAKKIYEKVKDNTNESLDYIIKTINDFNDSQLATLILYLNTDELDKGLAAWIKAHKDNILLYAEKQQAKQNIEGLISGYNEKTGLNEENVNTAFQDKSTFSYLQLAASKIGVSNVTSSEEVFGNAENIEQLTISTLAYIEATKDLVDKKEDIKTKINEELEKYDEENEEIKKVKETNDAANKTLEEKIKKNDDLIKNYAEVKQAIKDFANGEKDLTDTQLGYIQAVKKAFGKEGSDDLIQFLGESFNAYENNQNAVMALTSQLEEAENIHHNFKEELSKVDDATQKINGSIDNLQKSFKSLIDIVSEYNETGHFTIDNVQALSEMEDALVASLDFENNKLSINEEASQAAAKAKINLLKATAYAHYEAKMNEIAQMDEAAAISETAAVSIEAKIALGELGDEAAEVSKKLLNYAAALRSALESSNPGLTDAQKKLMDEQDKVLQNKLRAYDDAISEIDKGGYNFRRAMGTPTQADKDKDKQQKKTDKEKKREEDEIDRYWEINKALDKIADALKKVDKLKSHVFGKQKIQLLQQEASLIKQQTQLYEKLYEEQKKEAEELRAKLSAGGAAFSIEGEVLNYGAALRGALATYNKAVDDFNAGLIDDQAFKIAEDNYQKFKKDMDRYDKLFYTEMKNTREKIEEEAQKLRDIEIEKFEIKLQIKIDKAQLRKDFRNFRKELQKDFTLQYEVLPKTKDFRKDFKDDKSQVKSYMNAAKEIEKEIDIIMAGGTSKMFASLSEAQEKLKEVNEKFQEASKNTMQDVEDAWDNYIELIDQTNEKLDDQIERYNQIQDELDDWKQMIELVYGEKAYKEMDTYYKQAEENSLAQIASLKKISDAWAAQFQKAFEAEGASMERTDQWSEDLTKLYQNWINSENNLRDATNEHIKLLKDDYANAVEGIIDQLDKDLTGGKGLEQMKKEWEETKEYADKYYNTVQKAYQIQTLNNKIQKSINQQNSVKNAQKLEKLRQKELGELREMTNMSEYDLKIAEAKYDIALKEIALEEARNNKNSMKLTRNAEGNWSYQYVASEDEVADKEQDLLDAYMKLQDLSDEQMSKLMDEGLDAIENLKEEIRTVYKKAEAEYWSEKQLDDALAALRDKYYGEGGVITNIAKEFEKAREEAAESGLAVQATCYRLDQANFENLTNEIKRLFDDANDHLAKGYSEEEDGFEKTFERANSEMAKQWNDFLENNSTGIKPKWLEASKLMGQAWVGKEDSVKADVSTAFDGIKTKFNGYLTGLTELQKKSGITFKNISNYIKETAKETKEVNKNIKELVKQTKNIDKQRQAVEKLMSAWDKVKSSIDGASKSIEEYLKKQQDLKTPSTPETVGSSGSGSGYSGSESGSNSENGDYTPKTPQTPQNVTPQSNYVKDIQVNYKGKAKGGYNIWEFRKISSSGIYGPWQSVPDSKFRGYDGTRGEEVRSFYYNIYGHTPVSFGTGGYTGDWSGNEGHLATLHKKELVLNAKDTENFLTATNSLRDLVSLDSSIEKSISNAISKMLIHMTGANLNNTNMPSNNETNSNNIFNINAEFPNANDVTEIREAILSLPNLASQYIHRSGF